ncbi:hypothetical protein [Breznakia pachnodae]|uniref:ElaB/YqjD/DUF883 family membrane-anchored ribosome-binding protein n=1 Tax=Breznakia pachnodae TaxID=265178 RepID=A0ABU0E495_9FIRM|nr:hypothetical protein [Breznakia pachnodae]MDQ0361549.1 ElaB/YqjD/DUF883 family membrane-anchored ribosome-binding protein [Breznakia pachnodae]
MSKVLDKKISDLEKKKQKQLNEQEKIKKELEDIDQQLKPLYKLKSDADAAKKRLSEIEEKAKQL